MQDFVALQSGLPNHRATQTNIPWKFALNSVQVWKFRRLLPCFNIRDLKIRGRDKLRRLPEVNLHNEACLHEAQTRVLAVLVSSRTPFSLFCRRLENVSILGLFLPTITRNRFPFQICWPWCFLRSYSSRFLSEIFRNEEKKAIIYVHCLLLVFCVRDHECSCVPSQCPVKKSKSL